MRGVPGATVTVRAIATGAVRNARSDTNGRFTVSAVPAGDYRIEVSAAAFRGVSRDFAIAVRDRAVLAVKLGGGAVADTVMVVAENAPMRIRVGGNVGVMGGVPGGVLGGVIGGAPRAQFAMAPPVPAAKAFVASIDSVAAPKELAPAAAPRMRSYFPEALYINPEIITDQNGTATVAIPMADSITTWRMAMMASTARGALGSGASSVKVF